MTNHITASGKRSFAIDAKCSGELEDICKEAGLEKDFWKSISLSKTVFRGDRQEVSVQSTATGTYVAINCRGADLEVAQEIGNYLSRAGHRHVMDSDFNILSTTPRIRKIEDLY